jgi:hypothetical protein
MMINGSVTLKVTHLIMSKTNKLFRLKGTLKASYSLAHTMLYYSCFSSAVVAGATEMSAGATAGVIVLLTLTSQGCHKQSPLSERKVKSY